MGLIETLRDRGQWNRTVPDYPIRLADPNIYTQAADRIEKLEAALREIASCESRHPGDVVSIARTTLSP